MSIRNNPRIRQIERFCPLLRLPQNRRSDFGGGGRGFVSPQFKFRSNVSGLSRNFEKAITGRMWLLVLGWLVSACMPALTASTPTPVQSTPFPASRPSPSRPNPDTPIPTLTPAAALTPTPDCLEQGGQVEAFSLDSVSLGKPLQGYLYLPPCFAAERAATVPLLILLHGQSADAAQWLRLGLAETADRLIAEKVIPPLVIALPYEEYSLRNPYESGYDRALMDEFLPWLAGQYPAVCRQSSCRGLGGLSRGGGWALLIGFTQAERFAAIGGHSAPPFYGMESRLTLWLKKNPAESLPAVYLDAGEKDRYSRPIEEFHNRLVELGIAHEWRVNAGGHDEDYWQSQLEAYLRWYGEQLAADEPRR